MGYADSANTAPNGGLLTQLKDGYTGDNRSVMWSETGAETVGRYARNVVDFGKGLLPGSSLPEVGEQAGQGNYGTAMMLLGTELLGPLKEIRAVGGLEKAYAKEGLADLAQFRSGLGLKDGEGTLARLDIGGQAFYGINAHGQPITMSVNAITRTHAEADAFQQALNAGAKGGNATLFVDRALCMACGQNGGVRSMARQLGVGQVTVVTSQGIQVIKP